MQKGTVSIPVFKGGVWGVGWGGWGVSSFRQSKEIQKYRKQYLWESLNEIERNQEKVDALTALWM